MTESREAAPEREGERSVQVGRPWHRVFVDVLRRAGRLAQAASECEPLLALPGVEGVLRQVLQFQARLIAKGDRGAYDVSAALDAERAG